MRTAIREGGRGPANRPEKHQRGPKEHARKGRIGLELLRRRDRPPMMICSRNRFHNLKVFMTGTPTARVRMLSSPQTMRRDSGRCLT